MPRAEEGI
jgi:hypothetical protein